MLFKKYGFPDESELVICTVTKIQFNSVFVNLDDYGKSGMIHISEISPGRIRNIRDYVKEGKKVVCTVLRINKERGHIDLSLRRVNKTQHRQKMESIKKEIKAEKILEHVAKEHKLDLKKLYSQVMAEVTKEYEYMGDFFDDFVADNAKLSDLGLDKKIEKTLEELVRQRIKPPSVEIVGEYKVSIFDSNGIEKIRKAFTKGQKIHEDVKITYLGASKYEVRIVAEDYKIAEDLLKKTTDAVDSVLKDCTGKVEFVREGQKA